MKSTPAHDRQVSFDTVLELGALLPGVKASSSNRGVALKLKGRLVACTAINRSAETNSLMVCIDFPARNALVEKKPGTYYMTPHYRTSATVLVRLAKIGRSELHKLLEQAAQFVEGKTTKKTAKNTSTRS